MKLRPKLYRWKKNTVLYDGWLNAGFIAQNVNEAIPEAVGSDPKGYLTLTDRPIVGALVNAVKEQQAMIEFLKKQVSDMEKKIQSLSKESK